MRPSLLPFLLSGAEITLLVSAGAWLVCAVFGLVLAITYSLGPRTVKVPVRFIINVLRGIPPLLALYLIYFGLGQYGLNLSSILSAILGLGLVESGNTAEYYRAGFLTVPDEQREAGHSLGLTSVKTTRHVVLPQILPFMIPPLLNEYVGLLKLATLASAVGATEILYKSQLYMNKYGDLRTVSLTVIAIYVIATLPLLRVVSTLEHRIRARYE